MRIASDVVFSAWTFCDCKHYNSVVFPTCYVLFVIVFWTTWTSVFSGTVLFVRHL